MKDPKKFGIQGKFSGVVVMIPHLSKEAVINLKDDQDPWDPPLSAKGKEGCAVVRKALTDKFGDISKLPAYSGPALRAKQTAEGVLGKGVVFGFCDAMSQPDSGEMVGEGLVVYAPPGTAPTTETDWLELLEVSILFIEARMQNKPNQPQLMFCHSPHPACAIWAAAHGDKVPGPREIDTITPQANAKYRPFLIVTFVDGVITSLESAPQ